MPDFPLDVATAYHDGVLGRRRSRAVGEPRAGVPEVALVQGMAVADYLLPGLAAFGAWTRAHLVELPGFGGSGEPPHELSVPEFGRAVADWLTAQRLGPVVLAGHSSGTQVAAGHPRRRGPRVGKSDDRPDRPRLGTPAHSVAPRRPPRTTRPDRIP
jgi:pimeloyl-ACP methyl ester carboxylesterase